MGVLRCHARNQDLNATLYGASVFGACGIGILWGRVLYIFGLGTYCFAFNRTTFGVNIGVFGRLEYFYLGVATSWGFL